MERSSYPYFRRFTTPDSIQHNTTALQDFADNMRIYLSQLLRVPTALISVSITEQAIPGVEQGGEIHVDFRIYSSPDEKQRYGDIS